MAKIIVIVLLGSLAYLGGLARQGLTLDNVRYGVAARTAQYIVPLIAAEEQGFWKQNGLEVKWWIFPGAAPLSKAIVAGSIDIGGTSLPDVIQANARGVPMVSVAQWNKLDYHVWVGVGSPIKGPEDLAGRKLGVIALGGMSHAYGRFLARQLGLEKKIRFVGAAGIAPQIAALVTGAIDGVTLPDSSSGIVPLVLEGRIRSLVSISQYFPKEWADNGVSAPKWLTDKKPDVVRRTVKAALQGVAFMLKNKAWTIERMKKELGVKPEAASAMFDKFGFDPDARISRKAVENVRDFLIEYEIIPKEKAPPVDEVFTNRFVE